MSGKLQQQPLRAKVRDQRKRSGPQNPVAAPILESEAGNFAVGTLISSSLAPADALPAGDGQPLDPVVQSEMRDQFDEPLDTVRVHANADAATAAKEQSAKAFTVGEHIIFGASQFSPHSHAGRRLLAHELAHVIQQRRGAGSKRRADIQSLEDDADLAADAVASEGGAHAHVRGSSAPGIARQDEGKPTYGNLPQDKPDPVAVRRRMLLIQEGGKWYEERPGGPRYSAKGTYDFVVQKGRIWAVKGSAVMGALNPGHTEAAAGGRVEYAGTVRFGGGKTTRGRLQEWSNASGHYAPVRSLAEEGTRGTGLPIDKFKPVTGGFPEKGPQLPMYQPGTEPRGRAGATAPEPAAPRSEPKTEPGPKTAESPRAPSPPARTAPSPRTPQMPRSRGAPPPGPRGRGMVAFEITKGLLGWAGELIQEAAPRRALMQVEDEVRGKLFANPGKGVVIVLRWEMSYPIGSAKGVMQPTPWLFKDVETYPSETKKTGVTIREIPPNMRERKQYLWAPPIPEEELPPKESSVRPEDKPLPDVNYLGIHVRAKRILEQGESMLAQKGTKEFDKQLKTFIADKNAWNDTAGKEIAKLEPKWDANDRRKLGDIRDWFNEEAAALLKEAQSVRVVVKKSGRWLVPLGGIPGKEVRTLVKQGASLVELPGGFTDKNGLVWLKVRVTDTGEEGYIQTMYVTRQ